MHDTLLQPSVDTPAARDSVTIKRVDLIDAWRLLEAMAVSLDQIGGVLESDEEQRHALINFLTPEMAAAFNEARMRLGSYLPDDEAQAISENDVPYWDYKGVRKGKYVGVAKD